MSDNPYTPPQVPSEPAKPLIQFASREAMHRVAAICWLVSAALLPLHTHVSCTISQQIGFAGLLAGLASGVAEVSLAPYRLWSFWLFGIGGFVLFVMHPLLTH